MIVPVDVDVKFREAAPVIAEVALRVKNAITRDIEGTGWAFIGRTKTAESLAEKIETGRYQRWSELDDLYGCSIIVPTLNEEPDALAFLQSKFREVILRRRGGDDQLKDPQQFRFDSTRFIGTLKPTIDPEPPDAISRQRFEVQIRTAFEHAWAIATHKLVYKANVTDWRRLRLTAQLKSTSEQMDFLISGFDVVSDLIFAERWPAVEFRREIEDKFRQKVTDGSIPGECAPASWVRFTENVFAMLVGIYGRQINKIQLAEALRDIDAAIAANNGERFPRSISLAQFVLGALSTSGRATGGLRKYCPMVTDQLRNTFPSVASLTGPFDFHA